MFSSSRPPCPVWLWLPALCLALVSCRVVESPPNVVFIVWDTVRADHLSLYGYPRETTPALERWAKTARVFDCSAVSCWTMPSHASMFTGLFPVEHGVNTERSVLADDVETIAELLQANGYQTYLFSANPFISSGHGFAQGFQLEEHPDDEHLVEQAREALRKKLDPEKRRRVRKNWAAPLRAWKLKASGELATSRFFEFLDTRDADRPFFAFLNYMEAHQNRVPARSARERLLSAERVELSYHNNPPSKRLQRVSFVPRVDVAGNDRRGRVEHIRQDLADMVDHARVEDVLA